MVCVWSNFEECKVVRVVELRVRVVCILDLFRVRCAACWKENALVVEYPEFASRVAMICKVALIFMIPTFMMLVFQAIVLSNLS